MLTKYRHEVIKELLTEYLNLLEEQYDSDSDDEHDLEIGELVWKTRVTLDQLRWALFKMQPKEPRFSSTKDEPDEDV